MASRRGMAIRTEQANGRINAALARLTEGQDVPAAPSPQRDTVLREMQRLEWIADVLEGIDAVPPVPKDDEAEPTLLDLTRKEIVAIAAELGIEAPDKIKGGKPAIVEAIEAKRAELTAAAETGTPTDPNADPSASEDSGTDDEGNDDPNANDGTQDGA